MPKANNLSRAKSWTIQFDENESLLIKIFRILGILCSLVCVYLALMSDAKYNLWILPTTYAIIMIVLANNNVVHFTPGIITLNIVIFCRYALLPTSMSINSNELSVFSKQYNYIDLAVFIMWIELLGISLAIYFSGKSMRRKNRAVSQLNNMINFNDLKYGKIIAFSGVVVIAIMIIRFPYLVGGIELLTQGYLTNTVDISDIVGLVGIIWKSWTIWFGIYLLFILKKKNIKGKKLTILIVIEIAAVVLISFIGQVEISRWYTVVTFCAMYFSAIKMFPEKRKNITRWIIIPAIVFLFVTSIYKNTNYLQEGEGMLKYIKELFDISTMDSYFAGPFSVNNAIHMKESKDLGLFSIAYDLMRNFPVLNHYIDVSQSSVGAYALYMGRGDQILPLIGQSAVYFGFFLSPLLSVMSVVFIRFFDSRYLKATSLSMYIYAFVACWLGLATVLNFTICVSWFYVTIIPSFLLVRFTEITGTNQIRDYRNKEK